MITIMIMVMSLVALLVDFYIYRAAIRRFRWGRWWRVGYVIYAIVIDTAVVTALLFYRYALDMESTLLLRGVMWVIAIFFLHTVPKLVYMFFSLIDRVIRKYSHKEFHFFSLVGGILSIIVAIAMICGMTLGRSEIRVTRHQLEFDNLPAKFDGLKIVQFSDVHLGTLVHRERYLGRLVDSIMVLEPDIIINTGDLVNTHAWEFDQRAQELFRKLHATHGIYSVLGNHDLGFYIRDKVKMPPHTSVEELIKRQERLGWKMLVNESEYVRIGSDSILITGLNFPSDQLHNGHDSGLAGVDFVGTYENTDPESFNLVMSHAPQLWNELLDAGRGDLTLAGHVHAMQIVVGRGRWRISPAMLMYDRWSGLYREGDQFLYINDGAGYVMFPMRIGTRPEVTEIILKKR